MSDREVYEDQPFDQAFPIDDPEEIASNLAASPAPAVYEREQVEAKDVEHSGYYDNTSKGQPSEDDYYAHGGGGANNTDIMADDLFPPESPGHDSYDSADEYDPNDGGGGGDGPLGGDNSAEAAGNSGRYRGGGGGGEADPVSWNTEQEEEDARQYQQRGFDGSETPSEPSSDSQSLQSTSGEEEPLVPRLEGEYDPAEFAQLDVAPEVRDLFDYISDYKPKVQELETRLQPFIPDYIPAVGDIDAFIKVPGVDPQLEADGPVLGLEVLDEPCAAQSDPSVLDLHLRVLSKTSSGPAAKVTRVRDAQSNTKAVESWISSIGALHKEKEPASMHYTSPMPDVEDLMQEWPENFETVLRRIELPGADLDVPLKEYVQIVC
eukprot:UC1_evm1s1593